MQLDELYKPTDIEDVRGKLKAKITAVDSRNDSWMDDVTDALGKYGFSQTGSGKYGTVYLSNKYPFALKVFMKDSAYLKWVKFAMSNKNNPHVPKFRGKVIKITPFVYAIRMEKLAPLKSYAPLDKFMDNNDNDPLIAEIVDQLEKNENLLDLHRENAMIRPSTGELVIIDPYYNFYDTQNKKLTIDPDDIDKSVF